MDNPIKDQIAGLRAQARHFRGLAAQKRMFIRLMKSRPIGQRDPVAVLNARCHVAEYMQSARDLDARCTELRIQLGRGS